MIVKKKIGNIFLLLCLTSIGIINFNLFINNPIEINKIQYKDESIYDKLKISLIENWNISWDDGYNEYGHGIAVEESTGNIYVTGHNDDSGDTDVILIKYNSNGDYLWNVTWDSGRDDYVNDIKLDSNGHIYVTGSCGDSYGDMDVLLLKFNSSGGYKWDEIYDRGGLHDGASALEIDNEDLIYVVGTTFTSDQAMLLLQYNSTGDLQWESIFNGIEMQAGDDLVLDSMKNIYVAGVNGSAAASNDLLVVKFNSSGNHIWNRTWGQYGYTDQGLGVTLDSKNNVYVTGHTKSYGAIDYDYVVVKYDNNGNWQWNHTWGHKTWDEGKGIAVDSRDNIYICGFSAFSNVSLLKYSASGDLIWDKTWANNSVYQYWWLDIVIDSLDNIYITGYNRTGTSGAYDLFAAKFSIEYIPPPGSFNLNSNAGTPDNDGNFTLTWTSSSGANNYSIYQYSSFITEINDSLTLLEEEIDALSLPLTGYSNGSYHFIVVAFNNFGNTTSNNLKIDIEIPPDEQEDGGNGPYIPGYNLMILISAIVVLTSILIYRRLKLLNK